MMRFQITLPWAVKFGLASALAIVVATGPRSAVQADQAPDAEGVAASLANGTGEQPAAQVDPAPITAWIEQLDDDRYAVRKSAQKSLAAIGAPALPAVSDIAAKGSLESSTRAVSILMSWSDSADAALGLAALGKVAALKNRPTEAAIARERLAVVRENAAIAAVKALGGRVKPDRVSAMMGSTSGMLQVVIGPQWKGGVEGLAHIGEIRRTAVLSLWSAPLDDSAAPQLSTFSHIQRLEVYRTPLSPEAVATIQQSQPKLMVDVRASGARLGVRGLVIQEIVPGSPAEKAGLQLQDQIVAFGEVRIATFEQLTAEIAKIQPGEKATLEVVRRGQPTKSEVTFDSWGDAANAPDVETQPNLDDPFGGPIPGFAPQRVPTPQRR